MRINPEIREPMVPRFDVERIDSGEGDTIHVARAVATGNLQEVNLWTGTADECNTVMQVCAAAVLEVPLDSSLLLCYPHDGGLPEARWEQPEFNTYKSVLHLWRRG